MKLGGVIFACLGIIITVLVANGRWSTVWAAMLGGSGSAGATGGGTGYTGADPNSGSFGTYSTPTGTGW